MRKAVAALVLVTSSIAVAAAPVQMAPPRFDWIQLFNGKDLAGWTAKFAKHDPGDNLHDTFRVEDGFLKVRYDKWAAFDGEFGHLFYKDPFSYYLIAVEYRFVGEQLRSVGPGLAWAIRNNGLMLHAQAPGDMLRNQEFPNALEVQLLGGLSDGAARATASLCAYGVQVKMRGKLQDTPCIDSTSKTYDGDQWVRVEVLVQGDEVIRHIVENESVLDYERPRREDGHRLTEGFIAIQAVTAPTDFRKIEVVNLEGCADPKATNYRSYIIKANTEMCRYQVGTLGSGDVGK